VVRWEAPSLAVLVVCSKGTYVRSLARDLGEALGCGAHLTRLVRLWVGSFGLEDAVSLDEIGAAVRSGRLDSVLLPADTALADLSAIVVPENRAIDLGHGRAWPAAPWRLRRQARTAPPTDQSQGRARPSTGGAPPGALTRVYDTGGRLIGLAVKDDRHDVWRPRLALVRGAGDTGASRNSDATLAAARAVRDRARE
jgi:tRNA pseudouridine55 synthase